MHNPFVFIKTSMFLCLVLGQAQADPPSKSMLSSPSLSLISSMGSSGSVLSQMDPFQFTFGLHDLVEDATLAEIHLFHERALPPSFPFGFDALDQFTNALKSTSNGSVDNSTFQGVSLIKPMTLQIGDNPYVQYRDLMMKAIWVMKEKKKLEQKKSSKPEVLRNKPAMTISFKHPNSNCLDAKERIRRLEKFQTRSKAQLLLSYYHLTGGGSSTGHARLASMHQREVFNGCTSIHHLKWMAAIYSRVLEKSKAIGRPFDLAPVRQALSQCLNAISKNKHRRNTYYTSYVAPALKRQPSLSWNKPHLKLTQQRRELMLSVCKLTSAGLLSMGECRTLLAKINGRP